MRSMGAFLWILTGVPCLAGEAVNMGFGEEPRGTLPLEELVSWELDTETLRRQIGVTLVALETKGAEMKRLETETRRLQMMLAAIQCKGERPNPWPFLRGKVMGVRDDLVVISLGKDDGVKSGMIFRVVRGVRYLGEIRVLSVYRDMVGAQIEYRVGGETLQEGDDAFATEMVESRFQRKRPVIDETDRGLLKMIGARARSIAEQLGNLQRCLKDLDAEIGSRDGGAQPVEQKTIQGTVTAVREHFIEISAGKDEGVVAGQVLTVRRDGQWLTDATVVVVWQHQSGLIAEEIAGGVEIRVNDTVTNKVR
jgi:hypothetical protein